MTGFLFGVWVTAFIIALTPDPGYFSAVLVGAGLVALLIVLITVGLFSALLGNENK